MSAHTLSIDVSDFHWYRATSDRPFAPQRATLGVLTLWATLLARSIQTRDSRRQARPVVLLIAHRPPVPQNTIRAIRVSPESVPRFAHRPSVPRP
jgi:hypothetical protein